MEPTSITLTFTRAASLHSYGMPEARLARVAARRAFVEMKQCFMRAAADIEGAVGDELQREVRQSTEVTELWGLRSALFEALPKDSMLGAIHREEMRYHLDSVFPEGLTGNEPDAP